MAKYNPAEIAPLITFQSPSKGAAPYQRREDIADLRAVLEFAQQRDPSKQCLNRLADFLPTDVRKRRKLRAKLKDGLDGLYRGGGEVPAVWRIGPLRGFSIALEDSGDTLFTANKDDALLLRTIEALRGNIDSVRKCPRSGCGRLFVPVRRQRYCSTQCSQQVRFERFRSKLEPERWREWRHQQYVRTVAKTKGAKAARHVRRHAPRTTGQPAGEPKEA